MPNKIPIENVIKQLPSFVQIIPESYIGVRYPAKFIDLEYNEEFKAIPRAVIKLQHGCKSRSNDRRSKSEGYTGCKAKTPIEEIIELLPPYLEIDETTYRGVRYSARFYDTEYEVYFDGLVCNVLRNGKGYCPERKLAEFKKSITRTPQSIQEELDEKFPGKIHLYSDTYTATNAMATFQDLQTGKSFRCYVAIMLLGKYFNREKQRIWKNEVKNRDKNTCRICGQIHKIVTHHLYAWQSYPDLRFELKNGITLCADCHNKFHSAYTKGDATLEMFIDWVNKKGESLVTLASELNKLMPLVPS